MPTQTHAMQEPTGPIIIAGDWHGNAGFAHAALKWAKQAGAEGVLHLGDFGIWPGKPGQAYLKAVTRSLDQLGLWLAFIDGNHEDHWQLNALPLMNGVRPVTNRITHLPRGYRWTWHGQTWLALGGATSLDRRQRRVGISWWPEEAISAAEAEKVMADGPVDLMLTHDAPARARVPGLSEDCWDRQELANANAHRQLLQTVVDVVRPRQLWHGHMHVAYTHSMLIEDAACLVQGLACDADGVADNVTIVDPRWTTAAEMMA